METVKNMLKPNPTPPQQLPDSQRKLRQESRNVDRQVRDIQLEENGVQRAIKEAVKRNDLVSAKEDLEDEIAEIPFEELQKLRSDGRSIFHRSREQRNIARRANKNRPVEMSSKRPIGRFREVIQVPKKVFRDPRFESICGDYEESKFKKAYSFLYDEELPAEKRKLEKLLEKAKASESAKEIVTHIKWIDTQLREEEQRRKRDWKVSELRHTEKEAVKQGKKPFYVKKSTIRKQELMEKFEELKASGKLEKFLAKRRRKKAAKDHCYMPYRRPHAN